MIQVTGAQIILDGIVSDTIRQIHVVDCVESLLDITIAAALSKKENKRGEDLLI